MLNKFAKGFRTLFIYGTIISLCFISLNNHIHAQEISFIENEACACAAKFIEPETPHCTKLCDSYGPISTSSNIKLVLPMKFTPQELDNKNAFTAPDLATYINTRSPYDSTKLLNAKMSYFPSVSDKLKESYFYLNIKVVESNSILVEVPPFSPIFSLGFIETVTGLTSKNKIKFDLTNYFQERFISSGNQLRIEQFNVIFSQLVARFIFDHQRGEAIPDPLFSISFYPNNFTPYPNTTYEVYGSDIFLQPNSPGWRPTEKQKHSLELFRKEFPKFEKIDSTTPHANKKYVFTAFSENNSYILQHVLDQLKQEPWSGLTPAEAFLPFSLPLFFNLPKNFQPNRELSSSTDLESKEVKNDSAYFYPMGLLLKSDGWNCPNKTLSILSGTQSLNFQLNYIFFAKPVKSELSSFEVVSRDQLNGRAYFYDGKNKVFIDNFSKFNKKQKFYYANGNQEFQLIPTQRCGLYQTY